jgi:hypothetical protein
MDHQKISYEYCIFQNTKIVFFITKTFYNYVLVLIMYSYYVNHLICDYDVSTMWFYCNYMNTSYLLFMKIQRIDYAPILFSIWKTW